MAANSSALFRYTMIISVQKLLQVIKSNKHTEIEHESIEIEHQNTRQNTKNATEINWG